MARSANVRMRNRKHRFGLEPLEVRRLLAGRGLDRQRRRVNWTNANNWSGNALPTAADDVTINVAANPSIILASGNQSIHSLNNAENLSLNGGTLAVAHDRQQYGQRHRQRRHRFGRDVELRGRWWV
jgi:hypothetical protein